MKGGASGFGEKTEKEEYFRFNHLTYKNRRSKNSVDLKSGNLNYILWFISYYPFDNK